MADAFPVERLLFETSEGALLHLSHAVFFHLLHALLDEIRLLIPPILEFLLIDRFSIKRHLNNFRIFLCRFDSWSPLPSLISLVIVCAIDKVVVIHVASIQLSS